MATKSLFILHAHGRKCLKPKVVGAIRSLEVICHKYSARSRNEKEREERKGMEKKRKRKRRGEERRGKQPVIFIHSSRLNCLYLGLFGKLLTKNIV